MASSKSIRRAQEPVTYTCSLCESENNVNWYCNDCQETLCDRCKEVHSRGKKTKNDDIVTIWKANYKRQGEPVPEMCKLHPGKPQDVFCFDCQELVCNICLSKTHKQHNWKHLEETVTTVKRNLNEHMTTISQKVELFKAKISKLESTNNTSVKNIDAYRKEVNSQRIKLIAEVNSVADLVLGELSALEKEESTTYKTNCQQYQTKVRKLNRMHEEAGVAITSTSIGSMLETDYSMSITLSRYDVDVRTIVPKPPRFVVGNINRYLLRKMLGELHKETQYEKKDISSKHVRQISKFTVPQKDVINCICPVDDNYTWLSVYNYNSLVLVSKEGVVTDTVVLDFNPLNLAMVGTTDILMTSNPITRFVYKLSLHNKQVTRFADLRPCKAQDIRQVFVLSMTGNYKRATCLLDRKHKVKAPTSVGVDMSGDVWIGCGDGTVHVMRL